MVESLATLEVLDREEDVEQMRWDPGPWEGIEQRAGECEVDIDPTAHRAPPYLTFPRDQRHERGEVFTAVGAHQGVFVHPGHNWFVSSTPTEVDVHRTLAAMGRAFDAVAALAAASAERDG